MVKLMYFSAAWCGPCKAFGPQVQEAVSEFDGNNKFEFAKINADSDPGEMAAYDIKSIPTLLYLVGDRVAFKSVGARPKSEVINKIKELLNSN
jgi:thioredoxin 1